MAAIDHTRVPLQLSRGCVVASVQVDLVREVVESLQHDVLELIQRANARGLVVDLSGVDPLDPEEFWALRRAMEMARLMGAMPVMAGLRPGVVSALIDLDVDVTELDTTRTIDEALEMIAAMSDLDGATSPTRARVIIDLDWDETDDSDPI